MKLKDKIAVITGTASRRGIGKAIAREFAKEGAFIVATDRFEISEVVNEIKRNHGNCVGITMDVSKASDIKTMVEKVYKELGRIDILVNNAGICPFVPFLELTEDIWDATIAVNLTGVFLCSHAVVEAMVENDQRGRIINIASMCIEHPSANQTPYAASKGGVYMLTRNMALELAPYRINVNAIAPGPVETNILQGGEEILRELGHGKGASGWEKKSSRHKVEPGRVKYNNEEALQPYDIARAAVFLASEDAKNITGETIWVTGFSEIR